MLWTRRYQHCRVNIGPFPGRSKAILTICSRLRVCWNCRTHTSLDLRYPKASPPPRWIFAIVYVGRYAELEEERLLIPFQRRLRYKCYLHLRRIPTPWRSVSSIPCAQGFFLDQTGFHYHRMLVSHNPILNRAYSINTKCSNLCGHIRRNDLYLSKECRCRLWYVTLPFLCLNRTADSHLQNGSLLSSSPSMSSAFPLISSPRQRISNTKVTLNKESR